MVGDLVGLSDLQSIKGIGKVSAAEIRGKLGDFADVCAEDGDDMIKPYVIQSQANVFSSLVPLTVRITDAIGKPRYLEILRLHYGLLGCEPQTL
jgi:hypothetical protein